MKVTALAQENGLMEAKEVELVNNNLKIMFRDPERIKKLLSPVISKIAANPNAFIQEIKNKLVD